MAVSGAHAALDRRRHQWIETQLVLHEFQHFERLLTANLVRGHDLARERVGRLPQPRLDPE